jgi:hypothetical protein
MKDGLLLLGEALQLDHLLDYFLDSARVADLANGAQSRPEQGAIGRDQR